VARQREIIAQLNQRQARLDNGGLIELEDTLAKHTEDRDRLKADLSRLPETGALCRR